MYTYVQSTTAASYCHSPVRLLKHFDVNIKVKIMPALHVLDYTAKISCAGQRVFEGIRARNGLVSICTD